MPTPRKYDTEADRAAAYRVRKHEARLVELQAKGFPPLPAVPTIPGTRRWNALAEQGRYLFATIGHEMEAYYADRSDSWQEQDKGECFQDRQERLELVLEAIDHLRA